MLGHGAGAGDGVWGDGVGGGRGGPRGVVQRGHGVALTPVRGVDGGGEAAMRRHNQLVPSLAHFPFPFFLRPRAGRAGHTSL